tara:strand:+ start:2528 stop:3880 length:1353 start_codon:yes stop_codon:yes gene_type:complete
MAKQQKDVVAKYLKHYAEPESVVGTRLSKLTDHLLVIPAHNESATFLEGIRPALTAAHDRGQRTVCIVVVNATEASSQRIHDTNQNLLTSLKSHGPTARLHTFNETPCWHVETKHFDLVLIDKNSQHNRLPKREGVGLARKIGCDVALSYLHAGLSRAKFIHMSDCDVQLPDDYFTMTAPTSSAAVVYPFRHVPCGNTVLDEAHARYEAYLRYYILGLRYANSPYAFHTLGSCIAIESRAYAGVRGIPKREAGEDFYVLNKLAKLGKIHTAKSSPITIRARVSLRVPFGTGRATRELVKDINAYRIYAPKLFALLRVWLLALGGIGLSSPDKVYDIVRRSLTATLPPQDFKRLDTALQAIQAPKALREATTRSTLNQVRQKWAHDWFDGFRTLKLLHALRNTGIEDRPWRQALSEASFCRSPNTDLDALLSDQGQTFETCRYLAALENLN